jgi:CMP-N-acetylneuraminic acid synthetase
MRPAYFMSGDFYLSFVDTYRERLSFNHDLTSAYVVEHWQAPEVDEPHDLIIVDALIRARQEGKI